MHRRALLLAPIALALPACKEPYRVGEHVWVEWDEREYPAYIIEKKSRTRLRVHYDGYDKRWDEDVTLDRIKGRIPEGAQITPPPPPPRVARSMGINPRASSSAAPVMPYKVGDKVRVKWRGSVYAASVIAVQPPDKVRVHYDGHEAAWDEVVPLERVLGRR